MGFQASGHVFLKKRACGIVPTIWGLPKIWGPFSEERKAHRQRIHKLGASENMGAIFLKTKKAAATYAQVRGFQKYGGHFSGGKKGPAATYPQVRGFQKYRGHFSEEKKAPAALYPQVRGF